MKFQASLVVMVVLAATDAHADDLFVAAATAGTTATVDRAGARWQRPEAPQALAQTLMDTRLLSTLHRFGAAPTTSDGALDLSQVTGLAVLKKGARSYTFMAAGERLRAMMVVIPVPVDPKKDTGDGWNADRLHLRREALRALSAFGLRAAQTDRYGNTFVWKGRAPSGAVHVVYVPEHDELVALYVRSN